MNDNNLIKEFRINLEHVRKIRTHIQELEDIINEIVKVLSSDNSLDQSYVKIVISNLKDCYYYAIMAWEKLNLLVYKKKYNLGVTKGLLYSSKSRYAQSISEVKILDNNKLINMISRLDQIFETCWRAFYKEYKIIEPFEEHKIPYENVLELSQTMYQLPCSLCGKIAVEFKIGYGRFDKEEALVFRGITHSRSFRRSLSTILFDILKTKNLSGVHEFMKQYHGYEGLDAYCPECDKIYCWDHYNAEEVWDEGFYDCTYGICPNGHRRMIDD